MGIRIRFSDLDHRETLEVARPDRALLHELVELALGFGDGIGSPLTGTIETAAGEALLGAPGDVAGNLACDVFNNLDADVTKGCRVAGSM